jgi:hypothetical protein
MGHQPEVGAGEPVPVPISTGRRNAVNVPARATNLPSSRAREQHWGFLASSAQILGLAGGLYVLLRRWDWL